MRYLVLLCVILTGPANAESYDIDVTIRFVASTADIPVNKLYGYNYVGYSESEVKSDNGRCVLYLVRPTSWNDREQLHIMGHELMHCIDGPHNGTAFFNN